MAFIAFCPSFSPYVLHQIPVTRFSDQYTVQQLCHVIQLPRSTYYKALSHEPSNRELELAAFQEKIKTIIMKTKNSMVHRKSKRFLKSQELSPI